MKQWVIKILAALLIVVLIFGVGTYFYVQKTLSEANITLLEEKTKNLIGPTTPVGAAIQFKEGALISKEEFRFFYLVSTESLPYDVYLRNQREDGVLEDVPASSRHFLVRSDFQLQPLIKNDCQDLFCFKHYASFDFIPPLFWKGIIAVEDARFLEHFGVDFISISRAFVANLKSLRFEQGGSTISQQLVKNLFFTNEKTIQRKINEMIVSIYIEQKFPKEKILEAYLNEFQWGGLQGIRVKGFYAASLFYFSKRPQDLTPYEISILVSLLKGPSYFSPLNHIDRLKNRSDVVFDKMVEKKDIPNRNDLKWSQKDWDNFQRQIKDREKSKYFLQLWSMPKENSYALNFYERFVLAQKVHEIRSKIFERYPEQAKDFAVKVLIKSLAEVADGESSQFYYYSKTERNLQRAIEDETHQVGSTLKPILYQILTKSDFSLSDEVSTGPISLNLTSGVWSPKEAGTVKETEVTLKDALLKSYNRPVIHLVNSYGFDKMETELDPYFPMMKKPLKEFPAQLLGSMEMSLAQLANAFEKFIKGSCEDLYLGNKTEDESVLYALSNPTQTTVARHLDPIFRNLRFFGKTGTTNSGFDNWYVAFDGKYLAMVWVGTEGNRGIKGLSLYGSTTAFQVYQSFFRDRGQRFNAFGCNLISGIR